MQLNLRRLVALGTFASFFIASDADAQIFRRRVRDVAPPPVAPSVEVVPDVPVQQEQIAQQIAQPRQAAGNIRRASYFMNTPIRLTGGGTAGQVADFILSDSGCLEYLVISHNNRYMMVPYSTAQFNWDQRFVSLNMDQARFSQVPTFTQWSTISGPQADYFRQVNTFFGVNTVRPAGGVDVNVQPGTQRVQPAAGTQPANPATPIPNQPTPAKKTSDRPNQPNPAPGPTNPARPEQGTRPPNAPATTPGTGPINPPIPNRPAQPGTQTNPSSDTTPEIPPRP